MPITRIRKCSLLHRIFSLGRNKQVKCPGVCIGSILICLKIPSQTPLQKAFLPFIIQQQKHPGICIVIRDRIIVSLTNHRLKRAFLLQRHCRFANMFLNQRHRDRRCQDITKPPQQDDPCECQYSISNHFHIHCRFLSQNIILLYFSRCITHLQLYHFWQI